MLNANLTRSRKGVCYTEIKVLSPSVIKSLNRDIKVYKLPLKDYLTPTL
jgi:hypothetical protein